MTTERMQAIRQRLDELNGFIKGTKKDTSPAADAERSALNIEATHLGAINMGNALDKRGVQPHQVCAICAHNVGYHVDAGSDAVVGSRCHVGAGFEELCDCSGFEYTLPAQR